MPRDLRAYENQKRAKALRGNALARREFAYPSVPREPAVGPTSPSVKVVDPEAARAIEQYMRDKNHGRR